MFVLMCVLSMPIRKGRKQYDERPVWLGDFSTEFVGRNDRILLRGVRKRKSQVHKHHNSHSGRREAPRRHRAVSRTFGGPLSSGLLEGRTTLDLLRGMVP